MMRRWLAAPGICMDRLETIISVPVVILAYEAGRHGWPWTWLW